MNLLPNLRFDLSKNEFNLCKNTKWIIKQKEENKRKKEQIRVFVAEGKQIKINQNC